MNWTRFNSSRNGYSLFSVGNITDEISGSQMVFLCISAVIFIIATGAFVSMIPVMIFFSGQKITVYTIIYATVCGIVQFVYLAKSIIQDKKQWVFLGYFFLGAILTIFGGLLLTFQVYDTISHSLAVILGFIWFIATVGILYQNENFRL